MGTPAQVFGNPQQEETRSFMRSFQDEEAEAPAQGVASKGKDEEIADSGTRLSLGQEE
jgi:hypothetical protein